MSELKSVAVAATVSQPELGAEVLRSNTPVPVTGGGFIGGFIAGAIVSMIDSTIEAQRAKSAESDITPVRDALVDFNAPEALRVALTAQLQEGGSPFPVTTVYLAEVKDGAAIRKLTASSKTNAILLISTDYHLTTEFESIRVLAKVRLITPQSARNDNAVPDLYANEFATYRNLPMHSGSGRIAAASAWASNKGAMAREAMISCFTELAAMIRFDLAQGTEANTPPKESLTSSAPATGRIGAVAGSRLAIKGMIAQQLGDRKWVRLQTGELSSTE